MQNGFDLALALVAGGDAGDASKSALLFFFSLFFFLTFSASVEQEREAEVVGAAPEERAVVFVLFLRGEGGGRG